MPNGYEPWGHASYSNRDKSKDKKYSAYHIISDRGLLPQLTMETIILQVSIYQK